MKLKCYSCRVVRINGLVCHESGCPESWRTEVRECRECGTAFRPQSRSQHECGDECAAAFAGLAFDLGGES